MGRGFLSFTQWFHCKRIPPTGEAMYHPWLLFLAWKIESFATTANFSALDIHWHSISLLSAGTILISPF